MWVMCAAFSEIEHRLGGGHCLGTVVHYLDQTLTASLDGQYSAEVGRELHAVSARLLDLAAFMHFDTGLQIQAAKYFAKALDLAKSSGDKALCAHVLTDMAMQAHHLRKVSESIELSRSAIDDAAESCSNRSRSRSHAVHARALALAGDAKGSDDALTAAVRALDRVEAQDEPAWIRFFDERQLATESLYAAADLDRPDRAWRFGEVTKAADEVMQRRHVLATAVLAATLVPNSDEAARKADADVDQVCVLIRRVIPLLPSMTSARGLGAVNQVRVRLSGHRNRSEVQAMEGELMVAMAGIA